MQTLWPRIVGAIGLFTDLEGFIMQAVHRAPAGLQLPTIIASKPIPNGLAFAIQDYLGTIECQRRGLTGPGAVRSRAQRLRLVIAAYKADGVL